MAGLTAAHSLSGPVTVYQRGWRLGGKGASHRGHHDRIEEHGLHVWLGYYDNAFRLMRSVYEELDRPTTDPSCPIRTIDDAFFPATKVGVFDRHDGMWSPWVARFSPQPTVPGLDGEAPAELRVLVQRAAALLADLLQSLGAQPVSARPRSGVEFSGSPHRSGLHPDGVAPAELIRRAEIGVLVGAVQMLNLLMRAPADMSAAGPQQAAIEQIATLRDELRHRIARNREAKRLWEAADLITTALIGIFADRLLDARKGFRAVNHLDFREWLASHGATPETLDGGLLRGMYDLVFAYRSGDHDHPQFEAGTGLLLAGRFFFDFKGALFWKMRAGMGETVIAPLYQVLHNRGVGFGFFHRLDRLRLDDGGRRVEAIEFVRQAPLVAGRTDYEPLVPVKGLPCFAERPDPTQLAGPTPVVDLERHGAPEPGATRVTLRRGRDFDNVVLAVSVGMLPHVAGELLEADPRWRNLAEGLGTVATQSAQVWTASDEAELGWPAPGSTVAGYVSPFDTYASMPHLIDLEGWGDPSPGSVAYFCAALSEREASAADADLQVRANLDEFLNRHGTQLWPGARRPDGSFDWGVVDAGEHLRRREAIFTRANTDPSDRYVQSLPGTGVHRLRADQSGFENLVPAGDWVDTGLNAGCIEAAVISGLQAANTLEGRSVSAGILGGWEPYRSTA